MGDPKKDFISRKTIDFIYFCLIVDLVNCCFYFKLKLRLKTATEYCKLRLQTENYSKLTSLSTLQASGFALNSFFVKSHTLLKSSDCR